MNLILLLIYQNTYVLAIFFRVHTGKFEYNSRTSKDYPTVFKDKKFMKNPDLSVKILLQKC